MWFRSGAKNFRKGVMFKYRLTALLLAFGMIEPHFHATADEADSNVTTVGCKASVT
jgi:hypothetical protein